MQKENPNKSIIKSSLETIKGFAKAVASSALANPHKLIFYQMLAKELTNANPISQKLICHHTKNKINLYFIGTLVVARKGIKTRRK